ncbi:hypothetical protein [Streptomyces sp. NPDC058603]|uniref:hypothetical protein n=1 Tax=Streptomyces sp. NPDC058603 TaxID=3346551 RepID=UPI00365C2B5B
MSWDESSVDGTPPSLLTPPDGGGVFGSSPMEKNAAANDIETELEPDTKRVSGEAKESTNTAVRTFDGWDTAAGLKKVVETWDKQVKVLMGRLSEEKTSLRATSSIFLQNDVSRGDEIRRIRSGLDEL